MPEQLAFRLRHATPADQAGAYAVCLQTGDSGQDGTADYPEDPEALGRIYVGPYIHLEPDLAFVLEDDLGVCGYVLAALDSERFYQRYREEWLPAVQGRHPAPAGDPAGWSPTQKLYYEYHHPDIYYPAALRAYPSHLHIDLVPRAQGRGQGRQMMAWILGQLAARGSPGTHLAMSEANERAHRFYLKLGFQEVTRVGATLPRVIYLARSLP